MALRLTYFRRTIYLALAVCNSISGTAIAQEGGGSSGKGLLGPLRIGPVVSVGFPHPVSYGIDFLYENVFSIGLSTGSFSQKFNADKSQLIDTSIALWDARVRWYVFQVSFFLGAAYDQQTLKAKTSKDLSYSANNISITVPTSGEMEANTPYVTPHFGWIWLWGSGFNLGFELGAQVPFGTEAKLTTELEDISESEEALLKSTKEYQDVEKGVNDLGKILGKTTLPYLALLRLGSYF